MNACAPRRDAPPGVPVYEKAAVGGGVCAEHTLSEVLAAVHELRPDLADIRRLYTPDVELGVGGDVPDGDVVGNVHAFQRPDGGFALVLQRGSGDCPSGCIVRDYWYFETSDDCGVALVGESHRNGECMEPDQLPRWGVPAAARPQDICGADLAPQDVSGTYSVTTCGQHLTCENSSREQPLPVTLTMRVQQDPDNLAQGTVSFDGTGLDSFDRQLFDATFERRAFTVNAQRSQEPSTCVEDWSFSLQYDLDGATERRLMFNYVRTPDCANAPGDYCKGDIYADLGDASRD